MLRSVGLGVLLCASLVLGSCDSSAWEFDLHERPALAILFKVRAPGTGFIPVEMFIGDCAKEGERRLLTIEVRYVQVNLQVEVRTLKFTTWTITTLISPLKNNNLIQITSGVTPGAPLTVLNNFTNMDATATCTIPPIKNITACFADTSFYATAPVPVLATILPFNPIVACTTPNLDRWKVVHHRCHVVPVAYDGAYNVTELMKQVVRSIEGTMVAHQVVAVRSLYENAVSETLATWSVSYDLLNVNTLQTVAVDTTYSISRNPNETWSVIHGLASNYNTTQINSTTLQNCTYGVVHNVSCGNYTLHSGTWSVANIFAINSNLTQCPPIINALLSCHIAPEEPETCASTAKTRFFDNIPRPFIALASGCGLALLFVVYAHGKKPKPKSQ